MRATAAMSFGPRTRVSNASRSDAARRPTASPRTPPTRSSRPPFDGSGAVGSAASSMLTMRTGAIGLLIGTTVPLGSLVVDGVGVGAAPAVAPGAGVGSTVVPFVVSSWFATTSLNSALTAFARSRASSALAAVAVISMMNVAGGAVTVICRARSSTVVSSPRSSMTGWSTRPLDATST